MNNTLIICQTKRRVLGSIPVVGSSNTIILGFPMALIAMESLLLIPPLKVEINACLTVSRSTCRNFSSISSGIK